MELKEAYTLLEDFARTELSGKGGYHTGWIKIDGRRICAECARHKRKTLYIYIKEGFRPFLKCFRISCDIRRYMTVKDFHDLGFTNNEAIKLLTENTTMTPVKTSNLNDEVPVIINDRFLNKNQLDYFKARTNIDLTEEDIVKYRIIPNLSEVIYDTYEEDIDTIEKFKQTKIKSNKDAITFADHDYSMYYYRGINSNIKLKFNTGISYGYTHVVGTPNTIVITEGIFDIINVMTKYCVIDDAVYIASGGIEAMAKDIIKYYAKYIDTMERLIIFADSDIKLQNKYTYNEKFYNKLIRTIENKLGKLAFKELYIVYSSRCKDFGDMREDIYPIKVKLK